VDVVRAEAECGPGCEVRGQRLAGQPRRGLAYDALNDGNSTRGDVVIVPAGVVDGVPTQQPYIDVAVAQDRREVATTGVERHAVLPQLGRSRKFVDVGEQLAPVEGAVLREREGQNGHRRLLIGSLKRITDAVQ